MKKIFTAMIFAGVLLALVTAGGADAGSLTVKRTLIQAAISAGMVLVGTHFLKRGEAA